jgi:transposase
MRLSGNRRGVPGTGKIMIDSDRVAKHYLPVERSQPFLLPPSVQEFIPEDDLAWFLIDAVAAMDTSAFHAKARLGRAGRAGYDPDMLLTLLIYAYCLGQRSSRRIEALCVRDLGFKVVTGNRVVDHSTIAEFRATHQAAIKNLFTQVLLLCAKAGLRQVGVVAVDGTKIAASAGMGKTRERETLQREYERLCAQVEQMLAEAAAVDASQDALFGADNRGDELPPELRRRMNRLARLRETLRQIDRARAEHDAEEHGQTPTGRPRRADKVA